MKKVCLFSIIAWMSTMILCSCDSGGSSGDSSSISCNEIAGSYVHDAYFMNGISDRLHITVSPNCSFTVVGNATGTTKGTLTSKQGNMYIGTGSSPLCNSGKFSVNVTDTGNDITWITTCK